MSRLLPLFLELGPYRVRFAETDADMARCQALRFKAFQAGTEADGDADAFDKIFTHVMIENRRGNALMCCFRLNYIPAGGSLTETYSAQYYELSGLEHMDGGKLELGRFCVDPETRDPNLVRLAWSVITRLVDGHDIEILFGCSSFAGTDAKAYEDAFALLKERHLAPMRWLPRPKAPKIFRFAQKLRLKKPNLKIANATLPPLLRTYLTMGGWVSDHAVVDNHMGTLHVFTGVEIKAIPPARKRLLRMDTV